MHFWTLLIWNRKCWVGFNQKSEGVFKLRLFKYDYRRKSQNLELMSAEINLKDMALFLFRFAFFQVHPWKGISFESFFALYIYILTSSSYIYNVYMYIYIIIIYIYIIIIYIYIQHCLRFPRNSSNIKGCFTMPRRERTVEEVLLGTPLHLAAFTGHLDLELSERINPT